MIISTYVLYSHEVKTYAVYADLSILSGIELDEERGINSDSDFTIRGRLMSLVEKVAYLKKKMANLPNEKKDRKPSKSCAPAHTHTSTHQHTHTQIHTHPNIILVLEK